MEDKHPRNNFITYFPHGASICSCFCSISAVALAVASRPAGFPLLGPLNERWKSRRQHYWMLPSWNAHDTFFHILYIFSTFSPNVFHTFFRCFHILSYMFSHFSILSFLHCSFCFLDFFYIFLTFFKFLQSYARPAADIIQNQLAAGSFFVCGYIECKIKILEITSLHISLMERPRHIFSIFVNSVTFNMFFIFLSYIGCCACGGPSASKFSFLCPLNER